MKGFFEEFKAFAMKGNVMELAIAVVIGGAFGKIVSSLVNNIVMPIIGLMLGGIDLTNFKHSVGNAEVTYGVFLQSVIDFLIIALVIFLVVKALNRATQKQEKEEEAPAEPSEEVKLLKEIRDGIQKL